MEREVEFSRGAPVEIYHSVEQADYIAVVALTPAGKIPIVRQFRPALEAYSWELPAGLVDPGEKPLDCARRELAEETGLTVRSIHSLGETFPCTGRLGNRIHSFFVRAGSRMARVEPEPGITVKLVSRQSWRGSFVPGILARNCISARCSLPSCMAFSPCRARQNANACEVTQCE